MTVAAKLRATGATLKLSLLEHRRKTFRFLKAGAAWLRQGLWQARFFFLTMLLVSLPVGLSAWWPCEHIVRRGGLVLQLLGIGMVVWGIRETRKRFEHPSFWTQVGQWWRGRPKYGGGIIVGVGTGRAAAAGSSVRAAVWSNVSPDATVDQRIEALEKNLTRVRDDLSHFQKATDDEIRRVDKSVKTEQQSRMKADHDLDRKIKETETGGLYISAMGAIFLFAGVVMGTLSAESACLLQTITGFDSSTCPP